MLTLYVRERGTGIRRSGQRLIVYKGQDVLQSVRLRDLQRVVLFGCIEVTASANSLLLENGIETVLLSYGGKFLGRLSPADSKNVFIRQAQFVRYDDMDFRVRIAKSIVSGKIKNARILLQRFLRNHPNDDLKIVVKKLEQIRLRIDRQIKLDTIFGIEGEGANVYFKAFGKMLISDFTFITRNRRPPRDPVNALLSFGYTLLSSEMTGVLASQGLDPYVGILHDLDFGRTSLALDLLEEFRHPVIDRLTLSLLNRFVLNQSHFDDRGECK